MRVGLAVAVVLAAAHAAAADPVEPAEPVLPRVLTAPTAWLPPAGAWVATFGIDHRGDGAAIAGYGLGGLAEIELGADTDIRVCRVCTVRPAPRWIGRAAFRIGAREDAWFTGMPAVVFGVRTAFVGYGLAAQHVEATDAYAVASRDLGIVRLHAGLDALSAGVDGHRLAARLRPLAGLELHPPMYPRSSLVGDIAWQPELDAVRGPSLGWLLGVGVRYQAFSWASIELAVRARQGDDLGDSTVLVRVNAATRP
jgi:opacity protein-like surface antigen